MEVIKKIRTRRGANLNIKGKASGNLVGGNLTLLTNTIGTRSEIDTKNKILFILFDLYDPHRAAVKWSNYIFLFSSFSNAFFVFRNS